MEEIAGGKANVRQWIGIAPATQGVAWADMEESTGFVSGAVFWSDLIRKGLNAVFRFLGINIEMQDLATNQLTTTSPTVTKLQNNVLQNRLNKYDVADGKEGKDTTYRVIMGYMPGKYELSVKNPLTLFKVIGFVDGISPTFPLVTKQKIGTMYSFTFIGDGLIANTQSVLGRGTIDVLGSLENPSRFNHVTIHHQQEVATKVIEYHGDPSKPSSSKYLPRDLEVNYPYALT